MEVEPQVILEDGEVMDDDASLGYTPLERPLTHHVTIRNQDGNLNLKNESDLSSISDSDSDYGNSNLLKRPKIDVKHWKESLNTNAKLKKYDIWSSHLQEDILTESLVSCDLSYIDRSRNVESYKRYRTLPTRHHADLRHKLNHKQPCTKQRQKREFGDKNDKDSDRVYLDFVKNDFSSDEEFTKDNEKSEFIQKLPDLRHTKLNPEQCRDKRRHNERNRKIRERKPEDSDEESNIKGSIRILLDLVANDCSTDEEVAKDIANKLYEEKDDLILRIVQIAGRSKAIQIFDDTKRIELDGGMLIMNRTRRRTPGGVFIFLLKRDNDLTEKQQKEIFSEEKEEQKRKVKQKAVKLQKKKHQIAAETNQQLPPLLNRSKLILKKVSENVHESESEEFVNNPPPSPVTDGKENSNDETNEEANATVNCSRNLCNYSVSFLDLEHSNIMDTF